MQYHFKQTNLQIACSWGKKPNPVILLNNLDT